MKKYHINDAGEIKPCSAEIQSCRFVEHASTQAEAEQILAEKYHHYTKPVKKFNPDKESAENSRIYAHVSIAYDHLHNGNDVGNNLEMFYYNSPAGRLELQRRINQSEYNKEYVAIQEKLHDENYKIPTITINDDAVMLEIEEV